MRSWPALAACGKRVAMPGGELFYYDSAAGSELGKPGAGGKPTVVLIHGLGDEADTWRHVFPKLVAAGYRVLAPDLPGFGRSSWKGGIGIGVHRKAVARLMELAGVSPDAGAVLVGSSLGAGIAELVAGDQPELVRGIVLVAGCFPFDNGFNKKFLLAALPFVGKKWYRGFRKNHGAAWRSLYSYYADLDSMDEADKSFLRERVIARVESPNQERGYLSTIRSMNGFLLFGSSSTARMMKSFPGRILILCGELDAVFPAENARLFRSLRPDAGFAVIAGAGHLPHQEKPEASCAELLRFLAELGDTCAGG